MAIRCSR